MSVAAKRWAKLAEDTEFDQLAGARKQAEGWRTGLTGLTALLAAVTIIKGPQSLSELDTWARWVVVGLLLAAFVLLVIGSLVATRAASGDPGDEIFLDGDALRDWMYREAKSVGGDIRLARAAMVVGLSALALATGLTWMGPRATPARTLVTVEVNGVRACGTLIRMDDRTLYLGDVQKPDTAPKVVTLTSGIRITPAGSCP
jgi:hypothetical protein